MNNNCINILNKEIGKCLIQNPTNINFWKIAVYNEFENNLNNLRARKLMQGCIRMNNKDLNAYLEYFTFEIKFAEKISERKNFLREKTKNYLFLLSGQIIYVPLHAKREKK